MTTVTDTRVAPATDAGHVDRLRDQWGLRKLVVQTDELLLEGGMAPATGARRGVVAAVLRNPWLGTAPDRDLAPEVEQVAPLLAELISARLIEALGGVDRIEAFGKAAVVGTAGEIEHGGALIHTPYFGNLLREFLDGQSIICFADARGEAGTSFVVPMWHKTHAATRSHYQTVTASLPDMPHADEIVVLAAASTGGRPHPRIGDRTTDPVVTVATVSAGAGSTRSGDQTMDSGHDVARQEEKS